MSMSATSLFDLSGRAALITGGTRGLGPQIAEALGAYGARVMLAARKQDELEQAHSVLSKQGIDAEWMVAPIGGLGQGGKPPVRDIQALKASA